MELGIVRFVALGQLGMVCIAAHQGQELIHPEESAVLCPSARIVITFRIQVVEHETHFPVLRDWLVQQPLKLQGSPIRHSVRGMKRPSGARDGL